MDHQIQKAESKSSRHRRHHKEKTVPEEMERTGKAKNKKKFLTFPRWDEKLSLLYTDLFELFYSS